jgi:DNA-binding LytR/AlgR family response regulator
LVVNNNFAGYNQQKPTSNRLYVNPVTDFANDTAWQFTYRELQRLIKSPQFWTGLVAVVLVLAIIGPFSTFENQDFSARLVFWGLMATSCYFVGFAVSVFVGRLALQAGASDVLSRLIGGAVSGLPVTIIVWVINKHIYGFTMEGRFSFLTLLVSCTIIAMAIAMIIYQITRAHRPDEVDDTVVKKPVAFLRRMPVGLGREIFSLEAQDHYVNVTTSKGSALVLIRLSDAIAELEGIEGLRIHRSWWVAKDAIIKTTRKNGKLMVALSNDAVLPVSRTYAGAVKGLVESTDRG